SLAKDLPRGTLPRGFSGEQPYWTLLGLDGGREQALMGEDGALEAVKSGFSVEPFVVLDGKAHGWADVRASQQLLDGYLPVPSVQWRHEQFDLQVTGFVFDIYRINQVAEELGHFGFEPVVKVLGHLVGRDRIEFAHPEPDLLRVDAHEVFFPVRC